MPCCLGLEAVRESEFISMVVRHWGMECPAIAVDRTIDFIEQEDCPPR